MAVHEKMTSETKAADKPLDPQSLNFIERIFYYEQLGLIEADNDNATSHTAAQGSACFDSWAMPDYMRK